MNEYIIKSYEEELGSEYFKLYVPNTVTESELKKALDMASKYATLYIDDVENITQEDREEYDEYLDEMVVEYEGYNGIDKFFGYLMMAYDWEYRETRRNYDYEFEW